ncbi:unnamed protein product, partial [marine sediment metagenome]
PIVMLVIWFVAFGCTVTTPSPAEPTRLVNVVELEQEYKLFIIRYEFAVQDLELQQKQQGDIMEMITKLASGSVADLPGLLQLLLTGGFFGAVTDNIRKRTVIAALKRK